MSRMNSRTTRSQSMLRKSTIFPSDVLLCIFANFSSNQVVIFRRVSKVWLDVIDNNRAMWRILDWDQSEDQESLDQAIDLLDEKSSSTIEEVSLRDRQGQDQDHFIKVLSKSRATLKYLSLYSSISRGLSNGGSTKDVRVSLLKLASNAPRLIGLILWENSMHKTRGSLVRDSDPLTRIKLVKGDIKDGLKILCLRRVVGSDDLSGLNLSSLVSYTEPTIRDPETWHRILFRASSTLVHLKLVMEESESSDSNRLLLPRLRVLEIEVAVSFPTQLDCPNLQVLMMSFGTFPYQVLSQHSRRQNLRRLPLSLEELWIDSHYTTENWDWLTMTKEVPKLKILKVSSSLFLNQLESRSAFTEMLEDRERLIQSEIRIKGIKMNSLEKLVIPKKLFNSGHLGRLRNVDGEMIDFEDYPKFVEIEC